MFKSILLSVSHGKYTILQNTKGVTIFFSFAIRSGHSLRLCSMCKYTLYFSFVDLNEQVKLITWKSTTNFYCWRIQKKMRKSQQLHISLVFTHIPEEVQKNFFFNLYGVSRSLFNIHIFLSYTRIEFIELSMNKWLFWCPFMQLYQNEKALPELVFSLDFKFCNLSFQFSSSLIWSLSLRIVFMRLWEIIYLLLNLCSAVTLQ